MLGRGQSPPRRQQPWTYLKRPFWFTLFNRSLIENECCCVSVVMFSFSDRIRPLADVCVAERIVTGVAESRDYSSAIKVRASPFILLWHANTVPKPKNLPSWLTHWRLRSYFGGLHPSGELYDHPRRIVRFLCYMLSIYLLNIWLTFSSLDGRDNETMMMLCVIVVFNITIVSVLYSSIVFSVLFFSNQRVLANIICHAHR